MNPTRRCTCAFFVAAAALLASGALAAAGAGGSAKGQLTLQGENGPLTAAITHVYLVNGPATFDMTKIAHHIVFSTKDESATIAACEDVRCATLLGGDGITVEVSAGAAPGWWAHVKPVQYSAIDDAGSLKLGTDTEKRLAGTFTIDRTNVSTEIQFDVPLTKAFPLSDD